MKHELEYANFQPKRENFHSGRKAPKTSIFCLRIHTDETADFFCKFRISVPNSFTSELVNFKLIKLNL